MQASASSTGGAQVLKMADKTPAERMARLFAGLDRAYGLYTLDGSTSAKGKAGGRARTIGGSVTPEIWQDHIDGRAGVGVVPIRDDGTCVFGAGDVDVYNLDVPALSHRVQKEKLPLVVVRSKSGGAHLYLFMKEATSCRVVRKALLDCMQILGFDGCEIFPKQENLANKTDIGNWINMPYFDAERTTRYAIVEGAALPRIEDFLDVAEAAQVTEAELASIAVPEDETLAEGPPCLQVIVRNGIPEGGRNEVMFSLGVYARMVGADKKIDWEPMLDEYNSRFCHPPLPRKEVNLIVRQLQKKEYYYKCQQQPLCNHCNKDMCRHRKYGIGGGGTDDPGVMLDSITKITTEPPIWMVSVNGVRLQMDTEEILSQAKFKKRIVEALNDVPSSVNAKAWDRLIRGLLRNAELIDAPADASPKGQLCYLLEQFCTTKAQARDRDELLMGKPWTEKGITYFRSNDLFKFLEQQRFRSFTMPQTFAVLKETFNLTEHQFKIKGKCVRAWGLKEFVHQSSAHDPVRISESAF